MAEDATQLANKGQALVSSGNVDRFPNATLQAIRNEVGSAEDRDQGIDLMQILRAIWRGKLLVVFLAGVLAAIGGYYAFFMTTPSYAAMSRMTLQIHDAKVVDLESVVAGVSTEQASLNTELEVIRSRELLERVAIQLDLTQSPEFNPFMQAVSPFTIDAVRDRISALVTGIEKEVFTPTDEQVLLTAVRILRGKIFVSVQRNTYIFNIRVTTQSPTQSVAIANALADIYIEDQLATKFAATEYAINWLSDRVLELEAELKEKEDAIKRLRSDSELTSAEALDALNIRAKDIREDVADAERNARVATENAEKARTLISDKNVQALVQHFNDPSLTRLANTLNRAGNDEATAAAAEETFFFRADGLRQALENSATRAEAQRIALQTSFDRIQIQIGEQSADLLELNQLIRDADATRVLYETFLTRLKEASVQVGLQQADSRILSTAIVGSYVSPQKDRIIMMFLVLGAVIGIAIVVLKELFSDGFRTGQELEQATGHTVLGQIPRMPIRKRGGLIDYLANNPTSAASEAIRNVRTSVLLSNIDNPPQVIMSTSSIPGEGKTTFAISLAQNLASMDRKVLLIEGDIRRRTFTQYFEQNPKGSLVSVLSGETTLEETVVRNSKIGADILMGQKAQINAADLLASERFSQFLQYMRKEYDYVIIDTPPVLVVPDARVVGQLCDAIVYTVRWDHTAKGQVQDGIRQLTSVGLRVSGLVLGQIDPKGMKRYGYGNRYGAYAGYGNQYYDQK